jgi:phage-related protein
VQPPCSRIRLRSFIGHARLKTVDRSRHGLRRHPICRDNSGVQFGGLPKDAKSLKGIGSGVFEIALAYERNAYRAVYAVQLGRKIYVLHAFQKKSKSGIKTPQKDVDLMIRRRYKEAEELAKREEE